MSCFSPLLLLTFAGTIPLSWEGSYLEVPVCGGAVSRREAYTPRPGDIILFRTRNVLVNFAYIASCSGGATHCGLVVPRPDGSLGLLEAPGRRHPVMVSDIPSRMSFYDGRVWVRRRQVPLTEGESASLTAFACAQAGKSFNTPGFVAPVFGKPVRKPHSRCTCPEELDRPRWFCSELLTAALVSAGLLDGCVARPRFTDPEDLRGDRLLDLSAGWEKGVRWYRCGPRGDSWWSEDCEGQRCWWQ